MTILGSIVIGFMPPIFSPPGFTRHFEWISHHHITNADRTQTNHKSRHYIRAGHVEGIRDVSWRHGEKAERLGRNRRAFVLTGFGEDFFVSLWINEVASWEKISEQRTSILLAGRGNKPVLARMCRMDKHYKQKLNQIVLWSWSGSCSIKYLLYLALPPTSVPCILE